MKRGYWNASPDADESWGFYKKPKDMKSLTPSNLTKSWNYTTSPDADPSWGRRSHLDEAQFRHKHLDHLIQDLQQIHKQYSILESGVYNELNDYVYARRDYVTPDILNHLAKKMLIMKTEYQTLQDMTIQVIREIQEISHAIKGAFRLPESRFSKMIPLFQDLLRHIGFINGPPTTTPIFIQQFINEEGLPTTATII